MMRRVQIGILVLVAWAAVAQAQTTRYVNADGVCGGSSPCYTTIQAAINACASGDTIQVAAGTYADASYLLLDVGESGKTITVEGVGTCTYASSNASFSVYLDTSIAAGSFKFKNMRIVPTAAQANVIRFRCTATSTATLTFEDCLIDSGANNSNGIYGDSGTGSQRVLVLDGTTLTAGTSAIDITSGLSMTITDSVITYGGTAQGYGIIPRGTWTSLKQTGGSVTGGANARNAVAVSDALSQTMGSVSLDGVTYTSNTTVSGYHAVLLSSSTTGSMHVRVTGCSVSNTSTASATGGLFVGVDSQSITYPLGTVYVADNAVNCESSHAMLVGGNAAGALVERNTITGEGDFGVVVKAENAVLRRNRIFHPTPVYVKGGSGCKLQYNTIINRAYETGTITTSSTGNRTVTLTGGTWPIWVNSDAVLKIGSTLYAVSSRTSDSVIVLGVDGPVASGSAYAMYSNSGTVQWLTDTQTGVGLSLLNNIVDAKGAKYTVYDMSGVNPECRWDRNVYVAGTSALAYFGGSTRADIAALRSAWGSTGTGVHADNDEGSVQSDPLVRDPAGGDFSLVSNSPALGASSDGLTVGAWQPPVRGLSPLRPGIVR